jgi:hypothetical protein
MSDTELAEAIKQWTKARWHDRNKWNRNPVGLAIRHAVESTGNWRNAPRGNPSKGRRVAMERKWQRENGTEETLASSLAS